MLLEGEENTGRNRFFQLLCLDILDAEKNAVTFENSDQYWLAERLNIFDCMQGVPALLENAKELTDEPI